MVDYVTVQKTNHNPRTDEDWVNESDRDKVADETPEDENKDGNDANPKDLVWTWVRQRCLSTTSNTRDNQGSTSYIDDQNKVVQTLAYGDHFFISFDTFLMLFVSGIKDDDILVHLLQIR